MPFVALAMALLGISDDRILFDFCVAVPTEAAARIGVVANRIPFVVSPSNHGRNPVPKCETPK